MATLYFSLMILLRKIGSTKNTTECNHLEVRIIIDEIEEKKTGQNL